MSPGRQRVVVIATEVGSALLTQMVLDRLLRSQASGLERRRPRLAAWPRAVAAEAAAAMGSPVFRFRVRSEAALERAAVLRRDQAQKTAQVPRQGGQRSKAAAPK